MKIFYFVIALTALTFSGRADAAPLYAATASGGPGELYIIDSTTGGVIQDIGPLNDVTGLNYPITGLAFHPLTGVLYGSTANQPVATQRKLVTINPATGLVTPVGNYNVAGTMADIGFDSLGNLYGVFSGGAHLHSINIATGQATQIGNSGVTGTSGGGLAVSSAGVVYGTPTASRFGTYDTTSGLYTNIAAPNRPGDAGAFAALDFDASGVLYAMHKRTGTPPPTNLVTIDPATAMVTLVGASILSLDAIAFRPAIIPEPGAIVLLAGAAVFGVLRNWRRR